MSFENFPYTDFHALNLDWIVKIVKECKELSGETAIGLADLKKYVQDYFSDLNVQTQINNKLDEMESDGSLAQIINQDIFSGLNAEIESVKTDSLANTAAITGIKNAITTVKAHFVKLHYQGIAVILDFATNNKHIYMLVDGGVNTDAAYPFYFSRYPDGGTYNDARTTYNYALSLGISHFDYAIISHFHEDHCGGFGYCLKNGLIDSNTKVYVNTYVDWSRVNATDTVNMEAKAYQNEFINTLIPTYQLNVAQPTLLQSITIDNARIQFSNTGELFSQYYALYPSTDFIYNNFCLVAQIYSGGESILLPADCQRDAQSINLNYFYPANIVSANHHGTDQDAYMPYLDKVQPNYWIFNMGESLVSTLWEISAIAWYAHYSGAKSFVTGFDGNMIVNISPLSTVNAIPHAPQKKSPYINAGFASASLTSGTDYKIPLLLNDSAIFKSMFALENGRLKVLETGTYAFRIQVSFTAATASADNEFFCTLKYYTGSGSFVIQQNNFNSIGSGSKTVQMALTTVVNANAGELYELWLAWPKHKRYA